jgi:Flavodoxin domain
MRALVVYESMYGNTHVVAEHVAGGLRPTHEVTIVAVGQATEELVAAADLLVVGGPTHMHGVSSVASRRLAVQAAGKEGSKLRLDPDATGPGLRDWLGWASPIGHGNALAATFDTRLDGLPLFTGRAGRGIARLLQRRGYRLIAAPESFIVGPDTRLLDGEDARATRWGSALGIIATDAYAPAGS